MTPTEMTIEPPVTQATDNGLSEGAKRWTNRTPKHKAIDRANAMKYLRKGRPLPAGKTLNDVIEGTWPGDETDEQISDALEKLS